MTDIGDLAFEHGVERSGEPPKVLWRVSALREWPYGGNTIHGPIPDINWFATEEAARKRAAWLADGLGEVLSVARYELAEVAGHCEHGVRDGDYCEPCNKAYKVARKKNG